MVGSHVLGRSKEQSITLCILYFFVVMVPTLAQNSSQVYLRTASPCRQMNQESTDAGVQIEDHNV